MKVKLKSKCKTEIVRRKNLLHTEKLNIWLRKSLNKHSSTFLSLSEAKMVQDEQRRTFVGLLNMFLSSSHGLLHRSLLQQSSFVSSQSKIHRSPSLFLPQAFEDKSQGSYKFCHQRRWCLVKYNKIYNNKGDFSPFSLCHIINVLRAFSDTCCDIVRSSRVCW